MCFAVQERITIGELRLDNSSKASRGRFSVIQRRLRLPHASDEAKQAAAFRPFTYLFLLKKKRWYRTITNNLGARGYLFRFEEESFSAKPRPRGAKRREEKYTTSAVSCIRCRLGNHAFPKPINWLVLGSEMTLTTNAWDSEVAHFGTASSFSTAFH